MESKINVTVRIKPLSEVERANEKNHIWNQVSENTIMNVKTKEMFTFDNVFGERSHTQEIFDSQVKELVISAMQGFNVTAFAYGQTSSGKTYTMRGYHDNDPGLIPLSIRQVFDYINADTDRNYQINVSYLEIYNETLNDLIDPNNKNLEIRESISKGIYINRLSECNVTTREEVLKYMWQGDDQRIIAETKLNEQSSRSHTVFRINITSKLKIDESKVRSSQLNLVDLAGSEGASRTQTDGLRLREGSNINRSLLALSNVINRLSSASGGKTFINFRDSKLTRILQTALGGNSKTAIICTMTQTLSNYQETLNTLHFGQKAKHVKTTVNVNEINQSMFNGQMGPELEKAQKEIAELKAKLKQFEQTTMDFSIAQSQVNQTSQSLVLGGVESMIIDSQPMRASLSGGKDSEFTVSFLKDQLRFVNEKLRKANQELEDKDSLISKLEHEKREMQRQCESMDVENIKMAEKLKDMLLNQSQINNTSVKHKKNTNNMLDSEKFRTPKVGKQQNKKVLEEDGIRCFDLERQSLLMAMGDVDNEEFDLRESIGFSNKGADLNNISMMSKKSNNIKPNNLQIQQNSQEQIELSQQIAIIEELNKLRRENEDILLINEKLELDKAILSKSQENNHALREELEQLKEDLLFQGEELQKYQRHSTSLADELQFYKAQNNDLLRRLDDCERTLMSASDNENNSSIFNLLLINQNRETQKILKDENAALKITIQKLKEEFKQLEMEKSRSESIRAEIEYNNRASEYNVEILKNQIENLNNEVALMKKQNDKQRKSIEIMRSTNERMSQDLEHYKKISLNPKKSSQLSSTPGPHQKAFTPIASGKMGGSMTPLDQSIIKERDSFPPVSQMTLFLPHQAQISIPVLNDCNLERVVHDQIILADKLMIDESDQAEIINMHELDAQINYLQHEVEDKQRKIDDLENQLAQSQQLAARNNMTESDIIKKLKFDTQILMQKLSEYKKAEKNVKELVNDYEQMKLKYFNVLTENSAQKTQIQGLIQSKLDSELAMKLVNEEKQQYINDMYALRMDITKRLDELAKKNIQVSHLQEELSHSHKKVTEFVKKDKEIADLQNVIEHFVGSFGLIDKHLKTLVKLLREFIGKCDDPKVIEHNQKQIKSIESLVEELKLNLNQHGGASSDAANRLTESFFQISNDSLRDVQNSALMNSNMNNETNISIPPEVEAKKVATASLLGKRKKFNDEGEALQFKIIPSTLIGGDEENNHPGSSPQKINILPINYESADEAGTLIQKKITITSAQMTMSKKLKKFNDKLQTTASKKEIIHETPRRSERSTGK